MAQSVQDSWDKFERWQYRYKKTCSRTIKELADLGYSDFDGGLFLAKWYELNQDIILDFCLSKDELTRRIASKVDFLRGYLMDISYDGPEFMEGHSKFITMQYPSKCDNYMGVWLEQDLEGELEAGAYFGFQEFDVSFFCKSIEDVDLESMRNILPFDRLFVRLPKGKAWEAIGANQLVEKIKDDIGPNYIVKLNVNGNDYSELLSITLTQV